MRKGLSIGRRWTLVGNQCYRSRSNNPPMPPPKLPKIVEWHWLSTLDSKTLEWLCSQAGCHSILSGISSISRVEWIILAPTRIFIMPLKSPPNNRIAQRLSIWMLPVFFSRMTWRPAWYQDKDEPVIKTNWVNWACWWAGLVGQGSASLDGPEVWLLKTASGSLIYMAGPTDGYGACTICQQYAAKVTILMVMSVSNLDVMDLLCDIIK